MRSKDDECFGDRTNEDLDTDFDFEGNLALFDKDAIFSQIDGSSGHKAPHHSAPAEQKPQSYRHDENILEGKPVKYKQITAPQHVGKYYCTGKKKRFLINGILPTFRQSTSTPSLYFTSSQQCIIHELQEHQRSI